MTGMLEGKAVAVTGAGNGIGRAVALACAAEGANVVVADYGVAMDGSNPSSEVANLVVKEIEAAGGTAVAVAGDVSKFETGAEIVAAAVDTWGSIDGVVCVAGNLRERMVFNMSEEEWDAVLDVHLKGHFNLYRHASGVMRKQEGGGSIVGFTSAAFVGSTAQPNYSAAKGGIISLTRSTALALHKYGVRANCIAPSAKTRMSENVPFEIETGTPEAIGPMAVYLLSDASKEITGQTYTVIGPRISVWNQPAEVRSMFAPNGEEWTPAEIAEWLPKTIKSEEHPMLADLERRMAQMEQTKR
ncbi:MAG: Short-chain dehydrogenase [Actinomycetia bacterium]|nr:Short-chain dehydrogenase [Actinomycetes bacterium]